MLLVQRDSGDCVGAAAAVPGFQGTYLALP